MRDVLRDVAWLRSSSLPTAKQTLPVLFNIVNTAHPFREGNGRNQRQFFNDLATVPVSRSTGPRSPKR